MLRGAGKDAGQNDERKRKDKREEEGEERKSKVGRKRKRKRWREENTAGIVGVERKDPLYNPRNTGCSTRHIPTKDENGGPTGGPLITA